jgi:putative solute:sodium symporter small subunit
MERTERSAYWRANLRYVVSILAVWFAASYGAGIIFADELDAFSVGGFPLGYWFATQGSILVFVTLNFVYVGLMNALDRRFGVYEE